MNKSLHHDHRRQLAEWLAERELDRLLDDPGTETGAAAEFRYDRDVGEIEPGAIYVLLPAARRDAAWGPVYIMAMERLENSCWRVIPFARYAVPAVPGEWSTGLMMPPLRVLCFWNAREISSECILPGAAKKLTARLLRELHIVYRHVFFGEKADDRLTKRLGPPIQHPADPRYDYLDEEKMRLDEHKHRAAGQIIQFDDSDSSRLEWRLAAEGRPRYGKSPDE
jgi:hypothetical protein